MAQIRDIAKQHEPCFCMAIFKIFNKFKRRRGILMSLKNKHSIIVNITFAKKERAIWT